MAKVKRVRGQDQKGALTKKQIARSKKVARQQRIIWFSVASVTALVLIVLVIGVVQEFVLAPRQPVAVVNGEEVLRGEYQKQVRFGQWFLENQRQRLLLQQASYDLDDETQQFVLQYIGSQIEQIEQQKLALPNQVLDDLIEQALISQEAARRGLTVSQDEVQLAIEQQFGYDRNPSEPTPTPITTTTEITPTTPVTPMTREEFDESYSEFIKAMRSGVSGFSEKDYRNIVEQELLREKLRESLAAELPTTDEHVHAYHIQVETEEVATEVLEKLNAGADFADLVAQYSQDEDTIEVGGELGWLALDQFGVSSTLVEAAFALQPGEFSEVIQAYPGYHILTIDERRSDYPLDEDTLDWRKAQALDDWLTPTRQAATIEYNWSPEDVPSD